MVNPIILDGGKFSSSGTLLRCALAFSSITQKSFVIEKILLDSKFPGLNAQKVALIDAFAASTSAEVSGNGVGSTILQFSPSLPFSGKKIEIDFSSSTSVSLPLLAFLLPAIISKEKVFISLKGGTHVLNAPTSSFVKETIIRYLTPYFETLSFSTPLVGFYPKSEGYVVFSSTSRVSIGDKVKPLRIIPKESLIALRGELISSSERLKADSLRTINSLLSLSLKHFGVPLVLQPQYVSSLSSGVSLTLVALYGDSFGYDNALPFVIAMDKTWSSLSSIDKSVIENDCIAFSKDFSSLVSKGFVDVSSVQLILPFIALLGGSIDVSEVTNTMESIFYVSKELLNVDFVVDSVSSGEVPYFSISCSGYLNSFHDSLPSIEDI